MISEIGCMASAISIETTSYVQATSGHPGSGARCRAPLVSARSDEVSSASIAQRCDSCRGLSSLLSSWQPYVLQSG